MVNVTDEKTDFDKDRDVEALDCFLQLGCRKLFVGSAVEVKLVNGRAGDCFNVGDLLRNVSIGRVFFGIFFYLFDRSRVGTLSKRRISRQRSLLESPGVSGSSGCAMVAQRCVEKQNPC